MKRPLFATIVATMMLAGCQMNSAPDPVKSNNIVYFQDERTDICFAATNSYHDGTYQTTLTYVPCTPKVLAMVKK
jgi:nitrous oxide reductase accessory protein NosL